MPPKRRLSNFVADVNDCSPPAQPGRLFQESIDSQMVLNNISKSESSFIRAEYDQSWDDWRARPIPGSHPLANMVSAVQELIDPNFDPFQSTPDEKPLFLKPLPSRLPPEDIEYLRSKGALDIPSRELRNELLRCYVQWVHNFMPLLDLHEFLRCIAENNSDPGISLLLFQAVMFAGTAFVGIKYLQNAGFPTRRSARIAFFGRVKLLYSFDYEEDRLAILQSNLLMTYWYEANCSPQKDIWHWIGVCNTQAQSIGLHRDPTKSNMDVNTRKLRVRLWWSLYTRDRLIALALRRPMQISEGSCDVPMAKIDDFDIRPFHAATVDMLQCRQLEDASHQRHLAEMFIEKAKLCQCLGRVLFTRYIPSNHDLGAIHKTTITLIPRQASETELDRCSQKLDMWANGLSKLVKFYPDHSRFSKGDDVLYVHSAMLKMIYHATASALHRPISASNSSSACQNYSDRWQQNSLQRVTVAATGTAEIVDGLTHMNLTQFLPTSGVTVLLHATITHMTNLASPNHLLRDESKWNFHKCMTVLNGLRDIYPAADIEIANVETALKLKSIHSENSSMIQKSARLDSCGRGILSSTHHPSDTSDTPLHTTRIHFSGCQIPVSTRKGSLQGNVIELDEDENYHENYHAAETKSQSSTNLFSTPNQCLPPRVARVQDEDTYSFTLQSESPRLLGSPHLGFSLSTSIIPNLSGDTDSLLTMLGLSDIVENEEPWDIAMDSALDEQGQQHEDWGNRALDEQRLHESILTLSPSTSPSGNTGPPELVITGDLERDLGLLT